MYLERYSEHSQFQKQTDPSVSESEFNLKSFWYSIQRHNRLIVFCVLFAVALMAIRIQTQPDLFESRTKVLVENQGSIIGGSNNYFRMPQSIDTGILNQWILSTSVINKIEQILGPDIHVSKGNYSVNVLSKAQNYGINNQVLLSISAISQSPEHSYKMAQAIVKAFRAQLMDNQLQQSRESLSWMAERLAEQKRKVEEAEQRFQEYKQQIEVLSFEDQQAEESNRVMRTNTEISNIETEMLQLEVTLNKLKDAQKQGVEYSDLVFRSQNDDTISTLLADQNSLNLQLEEKKKMFKEKHPEIIELNQKLANLRTRIENEKNEIIQTLTISMRTLRDRLDVLERSKGQYKQSAHDTAQKEIQYRILERDVQTNTELYNSLLAELKKTDLRGKIESTVVTEIEPAYLPGRPISKDILKNIILAFVIGLVLGCGLAVVIDYFEPTVRTPDDAERHLGVPVVGMIPERD